MKKLSNLQENLLKKWIVSAEKTSFKISDLLLLDEKLNTLINSVEREHPVSYFPRLSNELV